MAPREIPNETLSRWMSREGVSGADLARHLAVSRAAVSKWMNGVMYPSLKHTKIIDLLSKGDVKSHIWPRAERTANSPAAQQLRSIIRDEGTSVAAMARSVDIKQSTFRHYITGTSTPPPAVIERLNKIYKTKLKRVDFKVTA